MNARQTTTSAAPLPADVRLMHAATRLLFALALVAFAALAILWAARQPFFAIRKVVVAGDVARNSVTTLRANAMPHLAGTFLTIDLDAVRRAFERVPWVRRAVVRRVWPDTLEVRLEEHRPVATWSNDAGDDRLVDSYGDVFEANLGDVEDETLPTLQGPDGSSAHVLAMLARFDAALGPLASRIDTLALSARGSWKATLESGAVVEIGRGSDEETVARAETFVQTLPEVTGRFKRPLAHADLRHRDGYAVRLKGVATLPPAAGANP